MNEQKVIRAIEYFETTAAKVVYIRLNPDKSKSNYDVRLRGETRIFEEILKLEGAEHFKFLVPCPEEIVLKEPIYAKRQQYRNAVGILWDMTKEEIDTYLWDWLFIVESPLTGKMAANYLRKFLNDMKAELGGREWHE